MKKFIILAAVAAMSLATVSCTKDEAQNQEATQTEQNEPGVVGKTDLATQKGTTVTIRDYTFEVPENFKLYRQSIYYKTDKLEVYLTDDNGNTITAYVDGEARKSDTPESDLENRRKIMGKDFTELKGEVIDGKSFFVRQFKDKAIYGYVRQFKEKDRITIDFYASSYAKVGKELTPEMMEAVLKSLK